MNRGRTEGLRFPAIPEREAKAKGCGTADRVANSLSHRFLRIPGMDTTVTDTRFLTPVLLVSSPSAPGVIRQVNTRS